MYKIKQNILGYFEVENKPSEIELNEYYTKKYYQEELSLYKKEYSQQDLTYINNKLSQKEYILNKILNNDLKGMKFLDVGCGEGYALNFFEIKGMLVTGIDYSNHGIMTHNKNQLNNLVTGEIVNNLQKLLQSEMKYDVILMDNILEHLLEPGKVLDLIYSLLNDNGVLMIEVPNDFSKLQMDLITNKLVDNQYWVVPPDHISYFNKASLSELCKVHGFKEELTVADFPIDLNLLDSKSNYIKEKEIGKLLHEKRIIIENYLNEIDIENLINIYTSLAQMGLGRNILSYFKKTERV